MGNAEKFLIRNHEWKGLARVISDFSNTCKHFCAHEHLMSDFCNVSKENIDFRNTSNWNTIFS
jgi:hypothetical protein